MRRQVGPRKRLVDRQRCVVHGAAAGHAGVNRGTRRIQTHNRRPRGATAGRPLRAPVLMTMASYRPRPRHASSTGRTTSTTARLTCGRQ